MKLPIFIAIISILCSCGSAQILYKSKGSDGSRVTVTKSFFSGIDYLYIERKNKKIKEYNIFYDCECGIGNKIWLQKAIGEGAGRTSWVGVTDTVSQPIVFDELVSSSRFTLPLEFIPITQEEKYLLEHGLDKVNKECCKPSNKPVSKFIGWVRLK